VLQLLQNLNLALEEFQSLGIRQELVLLDLCENGAVKRLALPRG